MQSPEELVKYTLLGQYQYICFRKSRVALDNSNRLSRGSIQLQAMALETTALEECACTNLVLL